MPESPAQASFRKYRATENPRCPLETPYASALTQATQPLGAMPPPRRPSGRRRCSLRATCRSCSPCPSGAARRLCARRRIAPARLRRPRSAPEGDRVAVAEFGHRPVDPAHQPLPGTNSSLQRGRNVHETHPPAGAASPTRADAAPGKSSLNFLCSTAIGVVSNPETEPKSAKGVSLQ